MNNFWVTISPLFCSRAIYVPFVRRGSPMRSPRLIWMIIGTPTRGGVESYMGLVRKKKVKKSPYLIELLGTLNAHYSISFIFERNNMKKTFIFTAFMLPLFLVTVFSFAQEPPQAQKNLQQFVGKWEGKNTAIEMDGKTIHTDYHAVFTSAAAGTGIMMHEWFTAEGIGEYIGENIAGFDPNTGLTHWYSIDNIGTCHDHYGHWVTNTHLFVQHQGVVDGKMFVEQIDFEFKSPTELHIKLTGMLNGIVNERIDGTFRKVP